MARLDKWLWAARFFKTRSLAKKAIEGGKVQYNGDRCKVSKDVEVGALLNIRQGYDNKEVEVLALSEQRRGAAEAQLLYAETAASTERRALEAERRKALRGLDLFPKQKPNKKERRQIHAFKQQNDS